MKTKFLLLIAVISLNLSASGHCSDNRFDKKTLLECQGHAKPSQEIEAQRQLERLLVIVNNTISQNHDNSTSVALRDNRALATIIDVGLFFNANSTNLGNFKISHEDQKKILHYFISQMRALDVARFHQRFQTYDSIKEIMEDVIRHHLLVADELSTIAKLFDKKEALNELMVIVMPLRVFIESVKLLHLRGPEARALIVERILRLNPNSWEARSVYEML